MDNPVDKVRNSGKPSLVDFGSKGCRPCDMLAPILKTLEKKYEGKANVIFISVREEQILASRYGIRSIPVQIFFDKNGKEVFRHTGFWPQAELEKKLRKNQFTLDDFREQMVQIRKMGSLSDLIGMIPGMSGNKQLKNLEVDDHELVKIEAVINSMTDKERRQHTIINGSRRKRIAKGSGTSVQDVNKLLKNYGQVLKMMKKINKGGMRGLGRGMLPI